MTAIFKSACNWLRSDDLGDDGNSRGARILPLIGVALVVVFNLIGLQSETANVPTLNDSSVHEEMVRFADQLIRAHHFPLDSWFPFIGLGSPQYLHYQSGGVLITSLFGLVVGSNRAFDWTLYLLLALWPVVIYWACRVFGFQRWCAAAAAVLSPFVISATGVGYEQQSYLFTGYGVWTQLWGMWTLPLAWAYSWRAVTQRRSILPAVIFIAFTAGFHFLTGYLAFLPIVIWVLLRPSQLRARVGRAVLVAASSALAAAWIIVPLIANGKWASVNELLANSPDSDSYGARVALRWLITGQIFDHERFPIITILFFIGLVVAIIRFRSDERCRAIVCVWVMSLILFFGRPTLCPLIDILPGHEDLFLRRFIIGVQLAGLVLAGIGLVVVVEALREALKALMRNRGQAIRPRVITAAVTVGVGLFVVVVLAPAWSQIASNDQDNASAISYQQTADAAQSTELNAIIAKIQSLGGGRAYSGLDAPDNWGQSFTIGDVPVFKYLASRDVDEVGYTLRTASLMTIPEAYFDEADPADYELFGIRFLVFPANRAPVVPCRLIMQRGQYVLWGVDSYSYMQVIETKGTIAANRTDVGSQTASFVDSDLPATNVYPTISYDNAAAAPATINSSGASPTAPGSIISQRINLEAGKASATVRLSRTAVVLLKVSFDPGWQVAVDGTAQPTEMIAPAMVGVRVQPGTHTVSFQYVGYPDYQWLWLVGLATLITVYFYDRSLWHRLVKRMRRN